MCHFVAISVLAIAEYVFRRGAVTISPWLPDHLDVFWVLLCCDITRQQVLTFRPIYLCLSACT